MNIFRRLALSRLLALCALVLVIAVSATALALGLTSGPTPPPKPLADAIHDALGAPKVQGVSAQIQFTNRLIEGSDLQTQGAGGAVTSSPLISGASGRLWISANGSARLELQSESGDTQIYYDGKGTLSLYDASSNTLDRYSLPAEEKQPAGTEPEHHEIPSVQRIQQMIDRLMGHAGLSGASPTDVAGQPAYAVSISPAHHGGLLHSAELAWDANHGVPLRIAVYSTTDSSPVIELLATDISYGPVPQSVFELSPPDGTKINDISAPEQHSGSDQKSSVQGLQAVSAALPFSLDAPAGLAGRTLSEVRLVHINRKPAALLTYGQGLDGIAVLESQPESGEHQSSGSSPLGDLPKVSVNGSDATALPTALGTVIDFRRSGVEYLLVGSVSQSVALDAARGL